MQQAKDRNLKKKYYKKIFSSQEGKAVIVDLMNYTGLYKRPVGQMSAEAYEERRNVMLYILSQVYGEIKDYEENDEIIKQFIQLSKEF